MDRSPEPDTLPLKIVWPLTLALMAALEPVRRMGLARVMADPTCKVAVDAPMDRAPLPKAALLLSARVPALSVVPPE